MGSLLPPFPARLASTPASTCGSPSIAGLLAHPLLPPPFGARPPLRPRCRPRRLTLSAPDRATPGGADDPGGIVQELRVPDSWLAPSKALEESEWLRVALHKWLDDEYCPEAMNVEISKLAAKSYYNSLLAKETDLGEILLKMARDLESLSYQESFHGAFSSANAAVHMITLRMGSSH